MNANFIMAQDKTFKNGKNGFMVNIQGEEALEADRKMYFTEALKAMRYCFILKKQTGLNISEEAITLLSNAHKLAKAVAPATEQPTENGEAEQASTEEPAAQTESVESNTAEPTPIIKQYEELKAKHPDALLLFRCGDFYESYNDDAKACAKILGITLTRRTADRIYMAGFPYHALDTYLPKLIRAGRRVAICDQLEKPVATKKRQITDMVSPAKPEQPAEDKPKAKRRGRKPKAESQKELSFNEESAK